TVAPTLVRPLAAQLALAGLCAVLGYLVLAPLVSLQLRAFSHGAQGYREGFTADRIGRTILDTAGLAVGSMAIALVLGTLLAWAASGLPRRARFLRIFPILPLVLPAVAAVVGWAFLLSPRPGYLNAALRLLPFWSGDTQGPFNVYSIEWIVLITGFSLSAF